MHLADIQPHILGEVVKFCSQEYIENPFMSSLSLSPCSTDTIMKPRVTFLFQMQPDTVMDMLGAAHYLQIPSLARYAISMLAEYAEGKLCL